MKRKIALILSLIMILATLISCGNGSEDTTATTQTTQTTTTTGIVIPTGYAKYNNGNITFAYPKSWGRTDGSVVILKPSGASGNNITVAYENKNTMYDTMTTAIFNRDIKPVYEAMGLAISSASVEHKNTNGENVTVVSYTAKVQGQSMKQTQFILHCGTRTYTVTVTEVTSDAALVQNVFNTLDVSK